MIDLVPLAIAGAFELRSEPVADERGFFARTIDRDVLRNSGLVDRFDQESLSYNERRGTLRGMHFQADPAPETKLVSCVAGRAFDVVLDLRRESATFGRWEARTLEASLCNSLYVPAGCAHGFQTLDDATTLVYRITPPYRPELARGVHPFDSEVGIRWPIADATMSQRDASLPSLRDAIP